MENYISDFLQEIKNNFEKKTFLKLTISNKRNKNVEINNIYVKPVIIKSKLNLNFVFRYNTKDITKNALIGDGLSDIEYFLNNDFKQADLFTTQANFYLKISKKGAINIKKTEVKQNQIAEFLHDNKKRKFINPENKIYLAELGLLSGAGKVKADMSNKIRQINKYIEIIDGILESEKLPQAFNVVDMGSGKGYLTFALYDYLVNSLNLDVKITGIEQQEKLVDHCNNVAQKSNFDKLSFLTAEIENAHFAGIDMLIALHACNTATDDAIVCGLRHNAKIIICAPCCHKQIRHQINPKNALILITKHGILCERIAENITDAIRAAILEAHGYKTKVFEFIATEHTPKNVMIVAIKNKKTAEKSEAILVKINELKKMFGIESHYLEEKIKILNF